MERILLLAVFVILFFLSACDLERGEDEEIMGLRPVYGKPEDIEIRALPAQEICQPGKIYIYGAYLFVNELHKGIHIIDNTDPSVPKNLSFIKIIGNVDMAVKHGYLYADHLTSMVVFDVSNPERAKFIKAVENAFDQGNNDFPAQTGVHFECVDPEKGPVIGWAEALLVDPQCFR